MQFKPSESQGFTEFTILGIDPGVSGAYALLHLPYLALEVAFLPTQPHPTRRNRREVDIRALSQHLRKASPIAFAVVEEVTAMPKQGVVSTGRFLFAAGSLQSMLSTLGIEYLRTPPAVWKSALNLSSDKTRSLAMAKKLFPDNALRGDFRRKKDHDKAEAALLAYFGYKFICQSQ